MRPLTSLRRSCASLAVVALALLPGRLTAQHDSTTVAAGAQYAAGGVRRFLLGSTYRDLWTTPVRVPVVNLGAFAGGLTPTEAGGGNTTRNLRFQSRTGSEYVFRFADKDNVPLRDEFRGTVVEAIGKDQVSATHPGAAVAVATLLAAAGVLHVTPQLAVLPDDPRLGEFRAEFAGRLGMLEEYPTAPAHGRRFAGATAILDTDSLRPMLDRTPRHQVNAEQYLAARLMDMLVNDWDRHPGNWKWALDSAPNARWSPIPRDRDKAFISFGGIVAAAGRVSANLVTFTATYPGMTALMWNSGDMDRRLLGGLDAQAFDSVAAALVRRLTDAVIDDAVQALPPEYRQRSASLGPILKQRRDSLPGVARRFYRHLAAVPDIHATDAADQALVTRRDDGTVEIELRSAAGGVHYRRRFQPADTREIRLYLHGGDDMAVVRGRAVRSIPVRVIGGNGTNTLTDSSVVDGRVAPTRLYDVGTTTGVAYGPDTTFDRRPWTTEAGHGVPPPRDVGARTSPLAGLGINIDLGVSVLLGLKQERHAFRHQPYARRLQATAEYATTVGGFRIIGVMDQRREASALHFTLRAQMSELEVINFQGLGNDSPDVPSGAARVRQQQWSLAPAVALVTGPRSDLSFGPVVQYTRTADESGTFVGTTRPYGSGQFGQAGLRVGLHHESGTSVDGRRRLRVDLRGDWFPALWDVASAFGSINARASVYQPLPIPLKPILFVRAEGRKLLGDFPFFEAAFIGGQRTVRNYDLQRFAGDLAVSGSTELQLPVARFPLVLPIDLGVFGYADAGRVYVDGNSPGGWRSGAGVGLWVGVPGPATALTVQVGSRSGRTVVWLQTGLSF